MTATILPDVETDSPPCNLCRAVPSRTLGEIWMEERLLGRVVQCGTCGLRFMSPRPSQGQRDWLYEKEYDSSLPGAHAETRFQSVQADQDQGRTRFVRYLDQLEYNQNPRRQGPPRLLDIGAGTGQLMELGRERGWDVYAVEQSEDACQHLRELFGAQSVVGRNLAGIRNGSGGYDAIIMAHLIEHLPDPLAALHTARRLLAPGGRLLVATPNEVSLYERLWRARQRRRGRGAANPYVTIAWRDGRWRRLPARRDEQGLVEFQILTTEHLFFFTRETLGRMLHRADFPRVRWASGSVAPANSRLGRLLRNDPVNRALFLLGAQAELVAVAEAERAA